MDVQSIAILIGAIATAITALITAIAGLIVAIRTNKNVEVVHTRINSRMDELLRISRSASHAEGVLEGKALASQIVVPKE